MRALQRDQLELIAPYALPGNLHARMGNVVVVGDGAALLARAEALLRSATPKEGYVALVAPLLLVSGRREIEILNVCTGRASFEKVGERSVLFTGQAKTKCSERAPGGARQYRGPTGNTGSKPGAGSMQRCQPPSKAYG